MKDRNLPPIQGTRFDIETLQYNAISLMEQADEGPTFMRHGGRVSYVVMTEKLFDELWPNPRRSWGINEMPLRMDQLFEEGLNKVLNRSGDD